MLLVMSTQGIFDNFMSPGSQSEVDTPKQLLWGMTWQRIEAFLPNFIQELFPNFIPPAATTNPPPTIEDSSVGHARESENVSGSTAVRSSPVTVPVQVISRGNSSPPPGLDVGSPSRSPQQCSITGTTICSLDLV